MPKRRRQTSRKTPSRKLTPNADRQREKKIAHVAALTGVPDAQRDPATIETLKVPQIGDDPRTADETVRRLSQVERLARAGVLEPHEADACDWYAQVAALAWDTTGVTASYEGRSGGGGANAPDTLMARHQRVAEARDDYREASALLPAAYRVAFEAVVLRNEALGPTAAAAFEELKRSQAEHRARLVLKFCANVLHQRYARLFGWRSAPDAAATATPKPSAPAPAAATPVAAEPARTVLDLVDAAIDGASDAAALWISPSVQTEMLIALSPTIVTAEAVEDKAISVYRGLPVAVRAGWRWGYVVVGDGVADALARSG